MEKPLREWTEADLRALVRFGRIEGPMLEYKAALYDSNDRGNREFLLDICSMANSNGGTLLIGVAEQRDANGPTGAPDPEADLGVECDNPEQVLTSSESRILDGVDQRLLVESHAIGLANSRRVALAFRVPNSIDKPHRVTYQGRTSFPARRERQRYELNAIEIKDMVMRTASRIDIAEQEIRRVLSLEVEAHELPTLTVGLIPVFTKNFAFDFRRQEVLDTFARMELTPEDGGHFYQPIFSIEGLTKQGLARGTKVSISHNGLILLTVKMPGWRNEEIPAFNPLTADLYIRWIARGCKAVFATASLTAPVLLGVAIHVPLESFTSDGSVFSDYENRVQPFNKRYPPLILDSLDSNLDQQIRPLCDLIHQSFGESHSQAFDGNGNWIYVRPARRR